MWWEEASPHAAGGRRRLTRSRPRPRPIPLTISHSVFNSSSSRCSHLRSLSIQASRSTCTMVFGHAPRCAGPLLPALSLSLVPLERARGGGALVCEGGRCVYSGQLGWEHLAFLASVCVCAQGERAALSVEKKNGGRGEEPAARSPALAHTRWHSLSDSQTPTFALPATPTPTPLPVAHAPREEAIKVHPPWP